jgi:hypothetical protein
LQNRFRVPGENNLKRVAHAASHENDRFPAQESFGHGPIDIGIAREEKKQTWFQLTGD